MTKYRIAATIAAFSCAALLISCGRDAQQQSGASLRDRTLVISAFAEPDLLIPPLTLTGQGLQVVDAVFDRLAQPTLSDAGVLSYAPALAKTWTWSADSLSIVFAIDERAHWHDGATVTANDVRFTWRAYVDSALGSATAEALRNIDSVQARDTSTAVFWFHRRSPDQLSDAVSQMRILPAHLLDSIPRGAWKTSAFARKPVGSGRFRFGSWEAGSRVELMADSANYRTRPGFDRVIWTVAQDPAAATLRLFSGDADFLESVRPDAAAEFSKHPDVTLLKSPALAYGFLQFNTRTASAREHPLFDNRALRRALTMVVDRSLVVRAVFDSLARVALGPMARVQLGGDTLLAQIPFDTTEASRLLDSLGWRRTSPGAVRTRNGKPLSFATLVPSSSTQRQRIAVLLQERFRAAGVQMDIEKVEFNTLNARLAKGDFDAAIMAIGADPQQSGIRGVWSSGASREKGGANFGDYRNAQFDALLDSAQAQTSERRARDFYQQAYRVILDDAPAIWLYEPWNLSGARRNVHTVGVRPDGWWMQLGEWSRASGK